VVDTPSPAPKGPIIAGVICGIVVLAIFTAMLWFFCRRRRQLDMLARSTPLVGNNGSNGGEKFAMDHSIDEEAQRHSRGVFAPFGGQFSRFLEPWRLLTRSSIPQDPICGGKRKQRSLVKSLLGYRHGRAHGRACGRSQRRRCRCAHSRPRKELLGSTTGT
jgi:hypothetical protein